MLEHLTINQQGHETATIFWLHGLGADGHDFAPIVHLLDLQHIKFILPHAPYRPVTLNNGYEMRAWYDIVGLQPDSPQDETGIRSMQSILNAMIENEIVRGIPSQRILLAGFSQGGAMALHTATRFEKPLAGVLALSTYLPLKNQLQSDQQVANKHLPIWMAHGRFDQVIALSTAQSSRDVLETAGYPLTWHEYDMPHSVCDEEISDIRNFLLTVLPA
ncbi:phospholipase/carboxylesterase [Methylophilus rhizosphaerae]|uniref:Phospholipase/carboxylesterase n=1 Tax=Methylophilus rhizosphaerae TaxID=492660 RepID=A0A1G9F088_9PROT|nr:dienelactone hydrolase family protein [Methylophilus rhizosphaerae]SDK81790.1 phospholipase/carboxylesterase [Methylophilus rhizosphaerae]